ncbi:MAG: hypothetical protein CMN72_00375 [Sphingomonas sp.]|nr:hypothetical protein [Sphingomonas sp.]
MKGDNLTIFFTAILTCLNLLKQIVIQDDYVRFSLTISKNSFNHIFKVGDLFSVGSCIIQIFTIPVFYFAYAIMLKNMNFYVKQPKFF